MLDNGPNEWHIQFQFFKWLETYPELREVSFAISNEKGDRSVKAMRNLKMSGLTAGVPDVCICYPTSRYHGMFIEFKSAIGRVSDEQFAMLTRLAKRNYKCVVCYSTGEAINAVLDYYKDLTATPVKKETTRKTAARKEVTPKTTRKRTRKQLASW